MELLHRCRDHAHKFYQDLFAAAIKSLGDELFALAETSNSNGEQRHFYEAMQQVQGRNDAMRVVFAEQLKIMFDDFVAGRDEEQSLDRQIDANQLSLVRREDLEDELAVSVIASKANSRNTELLWKLNRRLAASRGGRPVSDETNPFGPQRVCEAIRAAVHELSVDGRARMAIYKHLGKMFLVSFGKELRVLDELLIDQGILPNLRFVSERSPNTQSASPASQSVPPPAGEDSRGFSSQKQLYDAIRSLQLATTGPRLQTAGGVSYGNISTDGSGGADSFSVLDYALALNALQQSNDLINALAAGQRVPAEAVEKQVLQQLEVRARDSQRQKMTRSDADTVDVVGMIFRYVLDDIHLHDSVKSLLSLLHTPYLKLALIDKDFLEHYDHSARLLINRMADVGSRWVKSADDRTVLPKLRNVVDTVLKGFIDDVTIFDRLLDDFNRFRDGLEKRAQMVEKRNTAAQQGMEKLEVAKQRALDEIDRRFIGKEVVPAALQMLRQPWADFLSYNLLRHGEDSLSWKAALKVVDGVLWSVLPASVKRQRDQFRKDQRELDQSVEEGLKTIGYDAQATEHLLTALRSAQQLVFDTVTADDEASRAAVVVATASVAAEVEAEDVDAEDGAAAVDSNAVTGEREAIRPSAIEKQKALNRLNAAEREMVIKLKEIDFGTWFDFDCDTDKPRRLKLAWYSRVTSHYMFVDQSGVKQRVDDQVDLARAMVEGTVEVVQLSKKSFMERALEAVVHGLKRVGSAK